MLLPVNPVVPDGGELLTTTGGVMSFGPPCGEACLAQLPIMPAAAIINNPQFTSPTFILSAS
jgi:hypothetical protein